VTLLHSGTAMSKAGIDPLHAPKLLDSLRSCQDPQAGHGFLRQGDPVNIYPFIEAEKACRRNVKRACELLKVSRAAFYQHLRGIPSPRERQDAELADQTKAVHEEPEGRYGAPQVHAELRRRGHRHSRKPVARLMRRSGLRGRAAKRWKKTTIAGPAAAARADRSAATSPMTPLRSTLAGAGTSPTSRRGKGGCTWPPSSTSPHAASWALPSLITCAPSWLLTHWPTQSPRATRIRE
jgi:hypothetical protein